MVLGPGSWFSSVIPHLLVPELREALEQNVRPAGGGAQPRAAGGRDPRLRARRTTSAHCSSTPPSLRIHSVLAERRTVTDPETLRAAVASAGAELVLAELAELDADGQVTPRHDHELLASAYRTIFEAG